MISSPNNLQTRPDLQVEQPLWLGGFQFLAGIDEAGRGALAGPVAVGVLVLPPRPLLENHLSGVRDSKQMTPRQRRLWAERLKTIALAWAVGFADASEIDRLGIVSAVHLASSRALAALNLVPDYLLIDYFTLPGSDLPQTALVKGDRLSLSIAGAAILAKTARDARMEALEQDYPGYHLAVNKGYGTLAHREALQQLGPAEIHRRTFRVKLPESSQL
jgi:ribonuclease HII